MINYKVCHKAFGPGMVQKIDGDKVYILFGNQEKVFLLKGLDRFCQYDDAELKAMVDKANESARLKEIENQKKFESIAHNQTVLSDIKIIKPKIPARKYSTNYSNSDLLGPRAQTIYFENESQMYEVIGYLARPGRISSIEAEVPTDGRDETFEKLFPGQKYRPITINDTPSGMNNKLGPQFRINFLSTYNCPDILRRNLGAGNGSCVARLNKSRFVLSLVEDYGFVFGMDQNISMIRGIAAKAGHEEDFDRGYSL